MGENQNPSASRGKRAGETLWVAVVVIVFVAAVLLFGTVWAGQITAPLRWLIITALIVGLLIVIGSAINGRADGVLIDNLFKITLSRLQVVLWTILVLSAFLTIALPRALPGGMYDMARMTDAQRKAVLELSPGKELCFQGPIEGRTVTETAQLEEQCTPDPLAITFPPELVAALGISVASFASASLVKSMKRNQKADPAANKEVQDKQVAVNQAKAEMDAAQEAFVAAQNSANDWLGRVMDTEGKVKAAEAALAEASAAPGAATPPADPPADPTAQPPAEDVEVTLEILQRELEVYQDNYNQAREAFQQARKTKEEAEARYNGLLPGLDAAVQSSEQAEAGLLHRNTDPSQARWTDLFRGDEIGNYRLVDMSKVQMFFFTIVLVFAYAAAVYALLLNVDALRNPLGVDLPAFSASMNALLAISHAGYIAVTSVPHTKLAS
jgi:hypothetical protein